MSVSGETDTVRTVRIALTAFAVVWVLFTGSALLATAVLWLVGATVDLFA